MLRETDSEYCSVEQQIANIYEQYPKLRAVFDMEQESDLYEKDYNSLIEIILY